MNGSLYLPCLLFRGRNIGWLGSEGLGFDSLNKYMRRIVGGVTINALTKEM